MLKKILIILAVLLVCCGIGYLGYVIFMSKNIDKVELSGNMQTIYFVGDDLDFEDSKLLVTYKNGNMQLIDLKTANVTVTLFSTSIPTHGKMKITYKNHTIEQEYSVFNKGSYFVDSVKTTLMPSGNVISNTYELEKSTTIYSFLGDGKLRYYNRDTSTSDWYMNDGKYDTSYNYNITGDTITVNLGKNNKLNLKAVYTNDGLLYLSSRETVSPKDNPDAIISYADRTYKYYAMGDRKIDKNEGVCEVAYDKYRNDNVTSVDFKVGESFNSKEKKIYIKVVYINENMFMKTVYVEICDEMNTNAMYKLDTTYSKSTPHSTKIYYGDSDEGVIELFLFYTVV